MIAGTLLSDRYQPIPGKAARVTLIFELPPGSGVEIMVQCEVVRSQRFSQNDFSLSFKYIDLEESDYKLINNYIREIFPKH